MIFQPCHGKTAAHSVTGNHVFSQRSSNARERAIHAEQAIAKVLFMFKTIKYDDDIIVRVIWQAFSHDALQTVAQCMHGGLGLAAISWRIRGFAIEIPLYLIV